MKHILTFLVLLIVGTSYCQVELNLKFETDKDVKITMFEKSEKSISWKKENAKLRLPSGQQYVLMFELDSIKKYIYITTGPQKFEFFYSLLFSNNDSKIIVWRQDINSYEVFTLNKEQMINEGLY